MKKQHFILSFVMAAAAMLAVGCQKEEPATVTLGAQIEEAIGGAKAYIDGYTPCWHNGDMVYINDAAYPIVAASGSSARIEGVTTSSNYRAIFPASIVTPNTDISNNSSFPITLPSVQRYELVGNHQQVDVPMGAYLTNGSTLRFYNLCSIVRVTVSNALNQPLPLRHLVLEAENARLSGEGTATVSGDSTNHITMSGTARHAACLGFTADCPVTVPARGSKTFDIVVPAFARDNVTFTVYTTDDHYFETTKHNVSLWRNCITTVTLNVNQLTQITAAELVSGLNFRDAIPNNATAIVFEYNNPSVTSGTLLSTTNSPVPIYGNLDSDGTTWRISTAARMMNANNDCSWMFLDNYYPRHFNAIDFGEGFNTSNVTNMAYMFAQCTGITNLDVSHFNTSNVTDMSNMFNGCEALTHLDVSYFNTSNVTDMSSMFSWCSSLTSLDISQFNTSNVIDMSIMFAHCRGLTNLDLSSFNTTNVTNMGSMFLDCTGLTSLNVSNFNTSNVTNMGGMFDWCSSLTSLDIHHFNTSNVTNMSLMFDHCTSLTSLDVSNFNTSNVTSMHSMFCMCTGLTSLDVSHFNTENVESMYQMFGWCTGLSSLDVSGFNTTSVTNMGYMFKDCIDLRGLNVSSFNTSNVTRMDCMFENCRSLTSLDLSNFNTSNVTSMGRMLASCINLSTLDLSNFDMSGLGNTYEGVVYSGKEMMCANLSSSSSHCTIICPLDVENAIKETNPNCNPNDYEQPYYITGLPASGVTFTWVRPTSSK